MFRSTILLIVLAVAAGVFCGCVPGMALTWVQVGSTDTNTYTTPGVLPYSAVAFSPVGVMPVNLAVAGGVVPNFQITFQLAGTAGSWGNQLGGNQGLALYVAPTPSSTSGLFTGFYGNYNAGSWECKGIFALNASTAAAGSVTIPLSPGTYYNVTLTNVGGTVTVTSSDFGTQTYTVTTTDATNWAAGLRFAAFKSPPGSNWQYGLASVRNLTFYRDSDQVMPSGTLSGSAHLNGTTLATGATVTSQGGTYQAIVDGSGNYTMTMPPGTYTMTAHKAGYADDVETNVVVQDAQTTTQNFKLAGGILAGSVTYNGSATAGAGGTVRTQDSAYSATADSSGAYTLRLPPGTYTLVAHLQGSYADVTQSGVVVTDEATTSQDFAMTGPNWVLVATDAGPYQTPAMVLSAPGFSPTSGNMPSLFNIVGTYLPNIKVTYHIQHQSYYWENEACGFGGLALWGNATNLALGLFSGVNGGNNAGAWVNAPLVLNTGAGATVASTGNTANNADVTLSVVSAVAAVQDSAHPGASSTYNITPTDIANWAGNSKYAAFQDGNNFWQYGRQTITNITFYKDINQAPPPKGTIAGNVTMNFGTSHPPVVGALVAVAGGGTTTTDSTGNYSIELAPGTYSITVSKANCDSVTTANIVVVDQQTTTVNFDLPTSFISGTVTSAVPGHPAVAGVAVATTDGLASTTTDSAGAYILQVHTGTYSVYAYKYGFVPKTDSRIVGQQSVVTCNLTLDPGWDLAGDFSTPNPNRAWSYYYDIGTATGLMNSNEYPWAGSNSLAWRVANGVGGNAAFVRNYLLTPLTTWLPSINVNREGGKVVATSNVSTYKVFARFTAPTSGYFRISGRWAAEQPGGGTTGIGLRYNGVWMFGADSSTDINYKTVAGFAGTSTNAYTDSFGLDPVETYSIDMDLTTGETIEAVVENETGWAQTDLTITAPPSICYVQGRVTAANMPGNYGVAGANVRAFGFNSTYQTVTDANGNYILAIQPDTYTLEGSGPGYTVSTVSNVVLSFGDTLTQNFSLTHTNTWNLESDFNAIANPNGQWKYGFANGQYDTDPVPLVMWDTITTFSGLTGGIPVWTYGGSLNPWYGFIGKNTTGSTARVIHGTQVSYVPNNTISYGGGGGWWNSSPVGAVYPIVRWTAPDQRIIKLNFTVTNQAVGSGTTNLTVMKNNSIMLTKSASGSVGYAGTSANGYSDSVGSQGPAPVATFETQLLVNSGDMLDFMQGKDNGSGWWVGAYGSPIKSMGLSVIIDQGNAQICNSIADIMAKPASTVVFLTTPIALECQNDRFNDYSFFLESDDRSQAIKCLGSSDLPVYADGSKITLTGTVMIDGFGQKVLQVQSINSATTATAIKPLGMADKTVTASNKMVRVWGRVIEKVDNPAYTGDNTGWQWLYWTINDGSQNIKIPMTGQSGWMCTPFIPDPWPALQTQGDYIAVTGIAMLDSTGNLVVMPWRDTCFTDYAGR